MIKRYNNSLLKHSLNCTDCSSVPDLARYLSHHLP